MHAGVLTAASTCTPALSMLAAMNLSTRWLDRYLHPNRLGDATPETVSAQYEAMLMALGFPSESRLPVQTCEGPDTTIDLEVTSNRGDVLCHFGAARELAAHPSGAFRLVPPAFDPPAQGSQRVEHLFALENQVPDACPLFLVRVIRGVRVAESPAWLRALLEGAGQRPINNIVDATNFVALELGNPCHAFDLAKLAGSRIIVRCAHKCERLTTLDGKARTLAGDELVVADADHAQSLAGIMGGADSEVTAQTRDVVLEMATWDPVSVRRTSRRHQVRSTASHRYERVVDARTLSLAMDRASALIAELGGGTVCPGELRAGAATAQPTTVRFRPARCIALLGYSLPIETMVRHLRAVEVDVGPLGRGGDELLCTIPPHRHDLAREVDLIEEIARIQGLDAVPVHEKVGVRVAAPQSTQLASREIASVLTGLGFYETVTFSFTTPKDAKALVPQGMEVIQIDDERRGGEPALRPSVLSGLLACRRQNQHGGVRVEGGVRLFETAATYAQEREGNLHRTHERLNLGLLLDVTSKGHEGLQQGVRAMRGVIESIVARVCGTAALLRVEPSSPHCSALEDRAYARVSLQGRPAGYLGVVSTSMLAQWDLAQPVVVAELDATLLAALYPPRSEVVLPPAFPGIERDLSLIVDEDVRWERVESSVRRHAPPSMEHVAFVGTYRGAQTGKGKKSVTMRLTFRDAQRTLRNEEIDGPLAAMLTGMKSDVPFEIRA
jgi:phenylalanyl-tRNA synthetase beta chain